MISNLSYKIRKAERRIEDQATSADRFVDMGVLLRVVVQDPDGDALLPDKPDIKLRVIREHRFGGIIDTHQDPVRIVQGSRAPRVWYCSEDQEAVLLHNIREVIPGKPGQLVIGSEGAGKSTLLAMWHFIHGVLAHIGQRREGGQTVPSLERSEAFLGAVQALYDPKWYRHLKAKNILRFVDGPRGYGSRIRIRTTKLTSKAAGDPIQSYNWSWCGRDEGQDQVEVHESIHARLRAAEGGLASAPQLITATQKNDSSWRTLREQIRECGYFEVRTMDGRRSPFVHSSHWKAMEDTLSPFEFARRVGIQDLGPQDRLYPEWDPETRPNLIAIPEDWRDVTEEVLRRHGRGTTSHRYALLGGHDPGNLWDVSEILKAYRPPNGFDGFDWRDKWVWVVVDEISTEKTTTEQHVQKLLPYLQKKYMVNQFAYVRGQEVPDERYPFIYFRCDPHTPTGTQDRPAKETLTVFRKHGIEIHPAAYKPNSTNPSQVPRDESIEMVRNLLGAKRRRLFIAKGKDGKPVAPKLVKCFEECPMQPKKGPDDVSHWGDAIRYALWWIEKPRNQQLSVIQGGLS